MKIILAAVLCLLTVPTLGGQQVHVIAPDPPEVNHPPGIAPVNGPITTVVDLIDGPITLDTIGIWTDAVYVAGYTRFAIYAYLASTPAPAGPNVGACLAYFSVEEQGPWFPSVYFAAGDYGAGVSLDPPQSTNGVQTVGSLVFYRPIPSKYMRFRCYGYNDGINAAIVQDLKLMLRLE